MKKITMLLILGFICFSCSSKVFSQQTLYYNGGSGPQIPVTYDGSSTLTIGQLPAPYPHLRVDWFMPNGIYSEVYYPGSSFSRYSNYNFRISGEYWYIPGSSEEFPYSVSSSSYYVFY